MYCLQELGWNSHFEDAYQRCNAKNVIPSRIGSESRNRYKIISEEGEFEALLGDLLFKSFKSRKEFPAVGDWVLVEKRKQSEVYHITEVLPRTSCFCRKQKDTFGRNFEKTGSSDQQVLSANVDYVFLVVSLVYDYNLRTIERCMLLIRESGALGVILLNKADICSNASEKENEVKQIAKDMPVFQISAMTGYGVDQIADYMQSGKTISLIGASGTGKSTLLNRLYGDQVMTVKEVRTGDNRGKHTTTHREMTILPSGLIIIDNPGLRDIKVIGNEEQLNELFDDIMELESQCRFSDCRHRSEPDCAVKEAIENGFLNEARLESYRKLKSELNTLQNRTNERIKKEKRKEKIQKKASFFSDFD
ncbi:MAG TPA: ribosome small subunit-dependent GTPase A [Candidatus Cloacimonadota bacterium]|nr:ribosome small subunit-dependent GTPase A [Candidatus Cloacimonadota bacterium]